MASGNDGALAAASKPTMEVKMALEAARAAVLAVHAAVGLVWPHHRQAARGLRAAEGLCRSAVALLVSPSALLPPPVAPAGELPGGGRRRRRRGKRATASRCLRRWQALRRWQLLLAAKVVEMLLSSWLQAHAGCGSQKG